MLTLLSGLLPRACPGCREALGRAPGLCLSCRAELCPDLSAHSTLLRGSAPHLVSLGRYDGRLRRAVQALKYEGSREVALALGQALARGVPASWSVASVCAVPLHPRKRQRRGYNQAELLARAVASELGLPYHEHLHRVRDTRQQAKLRANERTCNVEGAFQATGPVHGTVLLIDDVLTTGATLRACAHALQHAGAASTVFMVAAR